MIIGLFCLAAIAVILMVVAVEDEGEDDPD